MNKNRACETHKTKDAEKDRKENSKENGAKFLTDEEMEENPPVPLDAHVNNILPSIFFSNNDVFISNQQICNFTGLYELQRSYLRIQRIFALKRCDYEESLDENMVAPLLATYFTR